MFATSCIARGYLLIHWVFEVVHVAPEVHEVFEGFENSDGQIKFLELDEKVPFCFHHCVEYHVKLLR